MVKSIIKQDCRLYYQGIWSSSVSCFDFWSTNLLFSNTESEPRKEQCFGSMWRLYRWTLLWGTTLCNSQQFVNTVCRTALLTYHNSFVSNTTVAGVLYQGVVMMRCRVNGEHPDNSAGWTGAPILEQTLKRSCRLTKSLPATAVCTQIYCTALMLLLNLKWCPYFFQIIIHAYQLLISLL